MDSAHLASPLSSVLKTNADHANSISSNSLSSGILTSAFDGSLYTYMHHIEFAEKLVVGTGNGSLRCKHNLVFRLILKLIYMRIK